MKVYPRYLFILLAAAMGTVLYRAAVTARSWDLLPHQRLAPSAVMVSGAPVTPPAVQELCSFETAKSVANWLCKSTERGGIRVRRSPRGATQGRYAMEILWKTDDWGYVAFTDFPRDWGAYRFLAFDCHNPMPGPVTFGLRVGDAFSSVDVNPANSAFRMTGVLRPGTARVRVPLSAVGGKVRLDGAPKIIHLRLYRRGMRVYIDNLRLEQ